MPIERVKPGETPSKAKRTTYDILTDWRTATKKIDNELVEGEEFADMSLQAQRTAEKLEDRGLHTELYPYDGKTYMIRVEDTDALADKAALNDKATTRSHIHIATTEGVPYCPVTERVGEGRARWLLKPVDVARRVDLPLCSSCRENASEAGVLSVINEVLNL